MKKKINKKKDIKEKKGFTLIELLAVIVILAIVLVIVIPKIIDTINESRISSLHSTSQGVATWWKNASTADELVPNEEKRVTGPSANEYLKAHHNEWVCFKDLYNVSNYLKSDDDSTKKSMFEVAEINPEEIKKSGVPYDGYAVTKSTCSSIMMDDNNKIVVLLVAKNLGKYDINDKSVTYAFSNEKNGQAY